MAEQKTRKQHYVWRNYLSSWSNPSEQCFVYLKNQKKIIKSNLMGIGQERDFYVVELLTEDEYNFTKKFIEMHQTSETIINSIWYLDMFQCLNKIKQRLVKSPISGNIENFIFNAGEKLQTEFENIGAKALSDLKDGKINFLYNKDNKMQFFYFLTLQYVRTKKMQQSLIKEIGQNFKNKDVKKMWNIMQYSVAQDLCYNMLFKQPFSLTLGVDNSKKIITCDQPVINICEEFDKSGIVKSLILYYPISPKYALIIKDSDSFSIETQQFKPEEVLKLNWFLYHNCNNQLYSNTSDFFNQLKK